MRYQMYFYCSCEYEVALTEGEGKTILQCAKCYNLASKQTTNTYSLVCRGCGHKEEIGDTVTFEGSKRCTRCALHGTIAYSEEDTISLFELQLQLIAREPCDTCKKEKWIEENAKGFTCPHCRSKVLRQKMSDAWDLESEKDE